jgi:hypothetical protein
VVGQPPGRAAHWALLRAAVGGSGLGATTTRPEAGDPAPGTGEGAGTSSQANSADVGSFPAPDQHSSARLRLALIGLDGHGTVASGAHPSFRERATGGPRHGFRVTQATGRFRRRWRWRWRWLPGFQHRPR